jgi:hypothetical protein
MLTTNLVVIQLVQKNEKMEEELERLRDENHVLKYAIDILKGFELIDREHEIKDVVGIFQQE